MTPRLRFLFSKAKPQIPLWDLACDHGYLGERALRSGEFPEVHFVDPVKHQIEKIRQRLQKTEFGARAFYYPIRAQKVEKKVLGNLVIAGIGGENLFQILNDLHLASRLQAERLILSPHTDLEHVMKQMQGWTFYELMEQSSIIEKGRVRTALVYSWSGPASLGIGGCSESGDNGQT